MNAVILLYGPTAVGKSAIAIKLAKMIDGEIISADSMQIYKGLNIGTAKVTNAEMDGIPHHLIDILEPNQDYSVSDFCENCTNLIDNIIARGKIPIVVGGTGLYFKALVDGYDFGGTAKNKEFRESLIDISNQEIYNKILLLDKDTKVDINNRHRLIRTLERLTFGNEPSQKTVLKYSYKMFVILDDRQKIYDRINNRVGKMVKEGILAELDYILSLNLPEDCLCMKAIGYKELIPYAKGEKSLDSCLEVLKQKTRNYAKRQFTFVNQFKNYERVDFCGVEETAKLIYEKLGV